MPHQKFDFQGITTQKNFLHEVTRCIPSLTNLPSLSAPSPPTVPPGNLGLSPEKNLWVFNLCFEIKILIKNWLFPEDSTLVFLFVFVLFSPHPSQGWHTGPRGWEGILFAPCQFQAVSTFSIHLLSFCEAHAIRLYSQAIPSP